MTYLTSLSTTIVVFLKSSWLLSDVVEPSGGPQHQLQPVYICIVWYMGKNVDMIIKRAERALLEVRIGQTVRKVKNLVETTEVLK